jgi:hypothetical protein
MQKLPPFFSAAVAMLMLTLAGCCGKNHPGESHDVVYAVGSVMRSPGAQIADQGIIGTIWKDGKVLKQTDFMATFTAVYVDSSTVYAAGITTGDNRAFLWNSNDPDNYLYFGNEASTPRAICRKGRGMWVVDEMGKLWNAFGGGISVDLGANACLTSAYSSDTEDAYYLAGCTSADGHDVAAVWLGNQPINYGEPFRGRFLGVHSPGPSVWLDGPSNNIYLAGVRDGGNDDIYPVWQKLGGASGRLGSGRGLANSVSVSDNDVYIAGVDESDDDNLIGAGIDVRGSGKVWKGNTNGTTFTPHISFGRDKNPIVVNAIGDSVYTLVYGITETAPSTFKVYKNHRPIHTFSYGEYPTRMFVVEAEQ